MELPIPSTNFEVKIYGDLTPFNQTISKARCRIFYTGPNRNGTYITEEFANKLLSTIAYAPVKGIYDSSDEDFTSHGKLNCEGRAYGVVPADYNLKWEPHLDDDGVERNYACVDVLLWTSIYNEASQVLGKSQSMELYAPSIKGKWINIDGQQMYQYDDACFLGLQVLGEEVEPCFEGASFYTLKSMVDNLYTLFNEKTVKKDKQGGKMMFNFKLSDNQKSESIFQQLNANYLTEENDWCIRYVVCDVYDQYALCYDYEESKYLRVYYTKDDANDSISLDKTEAAFIIDVNEAEYKALNALKEQYTFEDIDSKYTVALENETKLTNDVEELTNQVATYTTQAEELGTQIEGLNEQVSSLENEKTVLVSENDELKEFKLSIENEKKNELIDRYANIFSEETLKSFKENIAEYSLDDLDKELSYCYVQNTPSIFSTKKPVLVPKDTVTTGIEAILQKYHKDVI